MSGAPVMTRDDARALVERVVKMSKADDVQVNVSGGHQTNVRFADNRVSTSGGVSDLTIGVYSAFGPKHAVASTNDVSDAGLERAVRQSEALARLAPDDPEVMPLLGPTQYRETRAFFESTAELTPQARVQPARTAIAAAKADGALKAAGFIAAGAGIDALGNNQGLFAYHPSTSVNYTLTVRTADGTGSGWAGADHPDWSQVDFTAVADAAIRKARLSRNPQAIEPGRYTVILEPQAVGDLVQRMGQALNARTADEGRSAFSKRGGGSRIGERIVDERVTLLSDPTDPQLLSAPFDDQGLALGRQVWIENGVLKTLAYSRFWARKQGGPPTGSASALKLAGGDASVDDMIRSTPRGILVTRFWYIRPVDPRTLLFTGLTRDGTFLIEDGKIARSVRNLRFNESPLFMLNNVEMVGRPVRIAGTESGGNVVLPALKVREFNFTSVSEAV
ncbi:MAG: TldD/PmbA family protein [Gemmatimonadaceae bacterium]